MEARQQGDMIVIKISNKGTPIPEDKLNNIFDRFFRLDSSRSYNTGGAGLGLAIAKEIIKAHKGIISVESNEERTCFTITIPKKVG